MPEYSKAELKILKNFGDVIRARRESLDNMSQEELADKAGMHRTYIGGIEQGRRNLGLLNIIKIAKALEIQPEDLFAAMPKPKKGASKN